MEEDKKKIKLGWNEYFKPTPKNFRRAGDVLLFASTMAGIFVPGAKWVIALGVGGKFLTNFFSEKK